MAYVHGGNFALAVGTPGQRPWLGEGAPANGTPLAHLSAGVDASPPLALGRFITEHFDTVVDKTDGSSIDVLSLPDLEVYGDVTFALISSLQFRRRGATSAADDGVPVESQLVCAFILDRIKGRPQAQRHLTMG
ncbi:hypothetical protein PHYSODRAFT_304510 [Phytophthora sojae]|uniref:Uncharacterized protein n=1 Tax=Phytophthora sojae (strain P6497) TaxID=1094619 RepID=G5A1D2_PHYSP|nr:hypothetical protein PHYSODRAFT_304510 [Phytophthora sojae]EGZ10731.1 hypothetical protein PHYSODRAFT_304510 [Phytophthora sojae]|eukprot:XP_009533476.1 hypothetical protein PHYSODRAFT_304510 [Phytophthora sojae]